MKNILSIDKRSEIDSIVWKSFVICSFNFSHKMLMGFKMWHKLDKTTSVYSIVYDLYFFL